VQEVSIHWLDSQNRNKYFPYPCVRLCMYVFMHVFINVKIRLCLYACELDF
jgi:hypothetical protein